MVFLELLVLGKYKTSFHSATELQKHETNKHVHIAPRICKFDVEYSVIFNNQHSM